MSGGKLLKLVGPIVNKGSQSGSESIAAGVRHQTGQCGIDPYKPPRPLPPPVAEKFPDHLLRPPCMPNSEPVPRERQDCAGMKGFFCPPQRIKYKYPSFSENIDFVPSGGVECWWTRPQVCNFNDDEADLPIKVP